MMRVSLHEPTNITAKGKESYKTVKINKITEPDNIPNTRNRINIKILLDLYTYLTI